MERSNEKSVKSTNQYLITGIGENCEFEVWLSAR